MWKLLRNLKVRDALLFILEIGIVYACCYLELKIPDYMQNLTAIIQSGVNDIGEVWIAGGKMLLCALGGTIGTIVSGYISAYISSNFSYNIREKLFNHIVDLDTTTIKDFSTASLITRTTNDITQIQMTVSMGLTMIIKAPILAVMGILKIIDKSWQLSLITAIAVVIIVALILTVMLMVFPKFRIVQKLTDDINRIGRETLAGNKVIRAFNAEKYQEDKFENANGQLVDTQLYNRTRLSVMMPTMSLVMSLLSLAIYWIGSSLINQAALVEKGELFGNVVVFSSYAMYIIQAFMFLCMIFMMFPRAQVSARRINEVLNSPIKIEEGDVGTGSHLSGEIEFRNVSFHYKDGENVLENISFSAKKGETVAFIGTTGAGKSTLVGLAARLYDATEGEVRIDGIDIRDYSFRSLYGKIGYIPQKAVLFSDTVRNNIVFGEKDPPIREEDVWEAIDIAQAKDFVDRLPNCLEGEIAEGGNNLSGGQKQRLSIARAVSRKPEILIFDDSFSALDYKTDKELRRRISSDLKDTTCLIVAQRIGTIRNADRIVVLDEGKIVGSGTHEELLENCAVYREIAVSQMSEEELTKGGN